MYAGTGEGFYNTDGISGAGVFTSTDGGDDLEPAAVDGERELVVRQRLAISPNGAIDPGRDAIRHVPLDRRGRIVDEHAGRRR